MEAKIGQVTSRHYLSDDGIVATLSVMYIDSALEWLATFTVVCVIMGFVVTWDSESPAGEILRHYTRLLGWAVLYMLKKPAGWLVGLTAKIFAPFSKDIARYRDRRNWMPQH